MSINQMREYLYSAYPGKAWKTKVDKMVDGQVIAVYYSLIKRPKNHSTELICYSCKYYRTMDCPNSSMCFSLPEKPFFFLK